MQAFDSGFCRTGCNFISINYFVSNLKGGAKLGGQFLDGMTQAFGLGSVKQANKLVEERAKEFERKIKNNLPGAATVGRVGTVMQVGGAVTANLPLSAAGTLLSVSAAV